MSTFISMFHRFFHEKRNVIEDTYSDIEDTLGHPTPLITAADPMVRADSHHHVIAIADFMHHDMYLRPWTVQKSQISHESVINDPRFTLHHILISYY